MDDLISRQAAIDALKYNQDVYSHNFHDDPIDKYTTAIIAADIDTLVKLPSAQPEQRWIPITERLPDEYEYVLLCDREPEPDEEAGYSRMAVGWLEDGQICCWDDRAARKEFVAWMPLPEAYREEGDS